MSVQVKTPANKTIALALAGGGPLGGIYEIGVLLALQQALPTLKFHKLPMYVGVSAGSIIAACLANQFSIQEIANNLLKPDEMPHPIHPAMFYTPAWSEYLERLGSLPRVSWEAALDHIKRPQDASFIESLARLKQILPAGFFDNRPIEKYLRELFKHLGVTNHFTDIEPLLMIVASDLDCGHSVVFGKGEWSDVPISVAVQASTSVPGLYVPVKIKNHYFTDGILYKTVHASAAFDAGADLVICINPIVPYKNLNFAPEQSKQTSIIREGAVGIISQAVRAMVHSRSTTGFRQYTKEYKGKDILLFEPEPSDAAWFFENEFSFKNRAELVDKAFQATLMDLHQRRDEINKLLSKYDLTLDDHAFETTPTWNQRPTRRQRAVPPAILKLKRLLNEVDDEMTKNTG